MAWAIPSSLLATLMYPCETCGNHAAHHLVKRIRMFSFFFIPLFPVGTRYIDTCTACGRDLGVYREQAEAAASQAGPGLR